MSDEPTTWYCGAAGWTRGPKTLKIVFSFIAFRAFATNRRELWKIGANKNAMPRASYAFFKTSWLALRFTPARSRKSALPALPVLALLPCLRTFNPHEATTNAESVEQLKIFFFDPPVPQVSIKSVLSIFNFEDLSSTTAAIKDKYLLLIPL